LHKVKPMSKKGRILMAMSGGIDSSVAAMMLCEEGYEIIGITMKVWDYASSGGSSKETGCCSLDSINDARQIAVNTGFPHYVLDLREDFREHIISNFIDEYLSGRTPNPCVLCNTHIKWNALLRKADQLGCEYIATGHYAQVRQENDRFILAKGLDENKDQSYVLWGLSQESLKRTIFPLGGYRKSSIKDIAEKSGYKNLSQKSESYEICFIPDNDYRNYLNNKVPGLKEKYAEGNFISTDGKILGKHKGFPFYTIGQRKGLEIAVGSPLYVNKIIPETNTVVLGTKEELNSKAMMVRDLNLIKYPEIKDDLEVITKIRYKDKGTESRLKMKGDQIEVKFSDEVSAIAPGQSAVFYEGQDVVGGGIIV
jgi:tRNA-specific 2-thiouridylase